MTCLTIWRKVLLPAGAALLLAGAALAAAPAHAQLALPGATSAGAPGAAAPASRPKKAKSAARGDKTKAGKAQLPVAGVESIAGRPLMLNGGAGQLQISGSGDAAQIDKLSLAGEGVSDPSQKCVVNIVGDTPIKATSAGRPDGLARFEAEIPACPFAFDIIEGAVLVAPQITACVFKAADCQTSPSGLWGPDGAGLGADAEAIGKRRAEADGAMARALRGLQERAQASPEATDLVRDQSRFAGAREDTCRDYVKEAVHGFCAASVTEARAALLGARLQALGGEKAEKSAKSEKHTKPRKAKAAEAAPAAQPQ